MTSISQNNDGNESSSRKTPLGIERRFDRFGEWLDSSWALKKAYPVFNRNPHVVVLITWLMRIAVGATFVVSGLAKGIDPWGSYYKLQEYLIAMHIPLSEWGNTVLVLCFFLFSAEFFIGTSLLTGCFRKATPIMTALVMLVMLPLTLWIAVSDPVADCGCFGDFIQISNWATFSKNVLLSLGVVWLIKFNTKATCLIGPYLQWIAAVGITAYIVVVGLIGYRQQPMIDFRQYKIGSQLFVSEDEPEYLPAFEFIYEKNGVEKAFEEEDELPDEDDGWHFVRRVEKEFVKNDAPAIATPATSDFRVWNEDASEDLTETLSGAKRQLILLSPDIKNMSLAENWKINMLYDLAENRGMEFFAIVSGHTDDIEDWRDLSSGQYQIFTAEDTSIKELVRGNPALVYLENGKLIWKTALSAVILDDDDELRDDVRTYPIGMSMTGQQAFAYLTIILMSLLAALTLASHLLPIRK
ncbi:MAG: hypothetical protein NC095_08145 [Muribaculum sp.]|nr:hypothetical protein [Muribaculum sp.]